MRSLALLLALTPLACIAQSSLQSKVAAIANDAKGTVNVSCMLPGTALHCDLHPPNHAPMQSVYKLPLALTALHMVDLGTLLPTQRTGEPIDVTLDRAVQFLPTDIIPGSFSPLTDRYPKANVDVKLRDIISLAVGQSDNGAEEVLVRLVGGPLAVEHYMHSLGISAIQVRYSERDLDRNEDLQYQDWIEPAAAIQLLELLLNKPPVSTVANVFLLKTMDSPITPGRLRAGLPPGTPLAHKSGSSGLSGSSGTHGRIAAATNDIGLITLPDGRRLAIAVFVTDSRADNDTREAIIARIARAVYQEALVTK